MTEYPILMNEFSVRAILDGRKTQTRRVIKPQPRYCTSLFLSPVWLWRKQDYTFDSEFQLKRALIENCPYGAPGDRLWVRETWQLWHQVGPEGCYEIWGDGNNQHGIPKSCPESKNGWPWMLAYRANGEIDDMKWRPSIHQPRWASRISLVIEDVRVQRVRDISYQDILAEGINLHPTHDDSVLAFIGLWDSVNPVSHRYYENPWVWAITFGVDGGISYD